MSATDGGDVPFCLSEHAAVKNVENVVLFIADSVRYDYTPDSVKNLGLDTRAIAPSTFTASAVPSILTGTFPPEHKVWNFEHQLPRAPYLLRTAESGGVDVNNVWGTEYENDEKPTLSLLNLDSHTAIDELEPPFTHVVHDHGGHSPYGDPGEEFKPTQEFFEEHVDNPEAIVEKYREGVAKSVKRFVSIRDRLDDEGLLDETLLIFTSDHGELLGEYGGVYEHTSPMVPEVLEVPIVFCGAGISGEATSEGLVSSIDLATTILAAQGCPIPSEMVGFDLWEGRVSERSIRADTWRSSRFGESIKYAASSVWEDNGGVVIHRGPRWGRLAFSLGMNLYLAPYAPIARNRLIRNTKRLINSFVPNRIDYAPSNLSISTDNIMKEEFTKSTHSNEVSIDREKLEALGYVE